MTITQITLVSATAAGTQANSACQDADLSTDGRYVVFESWATNLVTGDTNGFADIFVKDLVTGTLSLVSISQYCLDGNTSTASNPNISGDGRYVVFESPSSVLVPSDSNGAIDIFVKDLNTGDVSLVSTAAGGGLANGGSYNAQISNDGHFAVFWSEATNLVGGDTNSFFDIFIKNLDTGAISRVSTSTGGSQANASSWYPSLSADGGVVAFESGASNLAAGDSNDAMDVYVRDFAGATVVRASTDSGGLLSDGHSWEAQVSADGSRVVFQSEATNLVLGDINGWQDIFIKNLATGATALVSTAADGSQGNNTSYFPDLSADGRFVVFESNASNLVPGDGNGFSDIFVKDTTSGAIMRISVAADGTQGNGNSWNPRITPDGRYVAFESYASNLVGTDANAQTDVFIAPNPLHATWGGTLNGSSAGETLIGGDGNDVLNGMAGNDVLKGMTGSDELNGAGGNDKLYGFGGNDVLKGGPGNDILNGGGAADTASYAGAVAGVAVNLALTTAQDTVGAGTDTLTAIEHLIGSSLNDALTGDTGANRLDGGAGNDILIGGVGNDTLIGGAGGDTAFYDGAASGVTVDLNLAGVAQDTGGAGTDTLNGIENLAGSGFNDFLTGNAGANTLSGGDGNDVLNGGDGNDTLIGRLGDDQIDGGAGSDTASYADSTAGVTVSLGIAAAQSTGGAGTDTLSGIERLTGSSFNDTLTGAAGANVLNGGGGRDVLNGLGGTDTLTGNGGNDVFVLGHSTASDTITDFTTGADDIRVRISAIAVGDADTLVENAATVAGPNGFAASAELVIFTADIGGAITAASAAAAIGSAGSAYAIGDKRLFAVDNGTSSALFLFAATDANAIVSAAELTQLASLTNAAGTVLGDYLFGA